MRETIQIVSGKQFIDRVKRYIKRHGDEVDVRLFTHDLLRKTRYVMGKQQKRLNKKSASS